MTRFAWVAGLVVMTGCGFGVGTTGWRDEGPGALARAGLRPAPEEATPAESVQEIRGGVAASPAAGEARVAEKLAGFSRLPRGIGYFWIGFNGIASGTNDLRYAGGGDGFSLGAGFRFGHSRRHFLELSFEKSVKHDAPTVLTGVTERQSARYERKTFGFRTTAAPRARMPRQPKPYVTYGFSFNDFTVRYDEYLGTWQEKWFANGPGWYLGLGVEFQVAKKAGLGFDAKYHWWTDDGKAGAKGDYAAWVFSLLSISRF
jgi:hypothetical protein